MAGTRSLSILRKIWITDNQKRPPKASTALCPPTRQRLPESFSDIPSDAVQFIQDGHHHDNAAKEETVLYLAYGSNLSAETFKGARGIQPLSQTNVLVPSLELTFDLPGIPYSEPCFANTRYRKSSSSLAHTDDYHKDRWHKGLIGVVYEVTQADYAHIIATEGGGSGYKDIVVQCHTIPAGSRIVHDHPTTAPFLAHTLFAPYIPPPPSGTPPSHPDGRVSRPDPSYAQPSARYLKLITDGAEEHGLPDEYRSFLYALRPYTLTSTRQRLGQFIFLSIWMPIIMAMFAIGRTFGDEEGRLPAWMIVVTNAVFRGVWASYDGFFKGMFGNGERTSEDEGDMESGRGRLGEKVLLLGG